jgi:hypothetical protein
VGSSVTAQAPLDRIAPQDFYRQLDWVRDEWDSSDEWQMTAKLTRLHRHFEHLPSRYYEQAVPLLEQLGHARLVNGKPWRQTIRQLADIVSAWNRARPPLLECPECGHTLRGHPALKSHRYVVHDVEDAA